MEKKGTKCLSGTDSWYFEELQEQGFVGERTGEGMLHE